MSIKSLKSSVKPAEMAAVSMPPQPRSDASHLRQIAANAARSLPSSVPARERSTVLVNFKVGAELADALAERATREGITQKQLVCQALAAYGLPVDPLDLQDRTRRRMRAIT